MKKKMIAIWAFMLLIGLTPMSCDLFCRDSCGCGTLPPTKEFSIKNLDIGDFVIGTSFYSPGTYYSLDQYFKTINVSSFEYLSQLQKSNSGFYFISGAYACSPIPPYSIQNITDLKVINKKETTLTNNSLILEGQEITDKFLISNYPTTSGQTIPDFLEKDQWIFMSEPFYLKWNEAISEETELKFEILIKLSDGQEFLFEEEVMKIK